MGPTLCLETLFFSACPEMTNRKLGSMWSLLDAPCYPLGVCLALSGVT